MAFQKLGRFSPNGTASTYQRRVGVDKEKAHLNEARTQLKRGWSCDRTTIIVGPHTTRQIKILDSQFIALNWLCAKRVLNLN